MNLSLSNEKCNMLMSEGIVLGHHISSKGIEVNEAKVNIIKNPSNNMKYIMSLSKMSNCMYKS
jgi:hypothetical protein